MEDTRPIKDMYYGWVNEFIKNDILSKAFPYAVLMLQMTHDFNIGSVVRSANGFGAEAVYYIGPNKKWDRRGAVGTYHYMNVNYIDTLEKLKELKNEYSFIGLETSVNSINLYDFDWKTSKKPLIIIGEEQGGISNEIITMCDKIVSIPLMGSIRSYNAAVAGSIAMYDLTSKLFIK